MDQLRIRPHQNGCRDKKEGLNEYKLKEKEATFWTTCLALCFGMSAIVEIFRFVYEMQYVVSRTVDSNEKYVRLHCDSA